MGIDQACVLGEAGVRGAGPLVTRKNNGIADAHKQDRIMSENLRTELSPAPPAHLQRVDARVIRSVPPP